MTALLPPLLGLAAFLCALAAGFLFAFAVVTMPGLKRLDDAAFVHAFQEIDGVIQRNAPLFLVMWGGSVVALVVSCVLGLGALGGIDRTLLAGAAALYLLGVQLPTVGVNIPLNNALQRINVDDAAARRDGRIAFERRWNRWNVFRTACACATTALLLVVLVRL